MDDFWLMVQQQNSDTIVMLCNCVEMHKEKSAKYWPEEVGDTLLLGENRKGVDLEVLTNYHGRVQYSLSQVRLDSEENRGHYICRTFTLTDQVSIITKIHCSNQAKWEAE